MLGTVWLCYNATLTTELGLESIRMFGVKYEIELRKLRRETYWVQS
jgi:hypothetical protein